MIDLVDIQPVPAGLPGAGRALVERFGEGRMEVPVAASAREWVASLMSRLPAVAGFAVVEHLFGVLPLIDACFEPRGAIAEVASGLKLGSLGLFTPTPEPGWGAATLEGLEGEAADGGLLLRGEIRVPSAISDGSIVLVRLAGPEHRLAWLDHGARGVERRASGTGGPAGESPCWLDVEEAPVGADLFSRPVTLASGGDLFRRLEAYASLWALAAAICARDGVRALRRAARTCRHRGTAYNTSQLVAMSITEVEIEAELTATAVQRDLALAADDPARAGGLALATAAARTLAAIAVRSADLRDRTGRALDGPFADDAAARTLTACLGGPLMLESELARALGLRDLPARETSG